MAMWTVAGIIQFDYDNVAIRHLMSFDVARTKFGRAAPRKECVPGGTEQMRCQMAERQEKRLERYCKREGSRQQKMIFMIRKYNIQ